jgi:hypothetical protein
MVMVVISFPSTTLGSDVVSISATLKVSSPSCELSSVIGTLMQWVSPGMEPTAKSRDIDVVVTKSVSAIAEADMKIQYYY